MNMNQTIHRIIFMVCTMLIAPAAYAMHENRHNTNQLKKELTDIITKTNTIIAQQIHAPKVFANITENNWQFIKRKIASDHQKLLTQGLPTHRSELQKQMVIAQEEHAIVKQLTMNDQTQEITLLSYLYLQRLMQPQSPLLESEESQALKEKQATIQQKISDINHVHSILQDEILMLGNRGIDWKKRTLKLLKNPPKTHHVEDRETKSQFVIAKLKNISQEENSSIDASAGFLHDLMNTAMDDLYNTYIAIGKSYHEKQEKIKRVQTKRKPTAPALWQSISQRHPRLAVTLNDLPAPETAERAPIKDRLQHAEWMQNHDLVCRTLVEPGVTS